LNTKVWIPDPKVGRLGIAVIRSKGNEALHRLNDN